MVSRLVSAAPPELCAPTLSSPGDGEVAGDEGGHHQEHRQADSPQLDSSGLISPCIVGAVRLP